MWIKLVVRTLTLLLVFSELVISLRHPSTQPPKKIQRHNVVTVKRIRIKEQRLQTRTNISGPVVNNINFDKFSAKRRARCRRYAQAYYGQTIYPTIEYSQQIPGYTNPGYYENQYIPTKCYNFCVNCPTSSCRRRCPTWEPPLPTSGTVQAQIIISQPDATKFPIKPVIKACNCDPDGSKYSSCDPESGNCICHPHYEQRTCNKCKAGYFKNLKKDCIKCQCNELGSEDSFCNDETGYCNCKRGVGGKHCDHCLPGFYGTVDIGCKECEPCNRKGHVCGKGGQCLCPPLSIGKECERCTIYAWGHEFGKGCKACNCSQAGSTSLQCDKNTGLCQCKLGYEGEKCDRCAFGFYGYPNCRKCLCHLIGTLDNECQNGDCQCNEDGSCNCKKYVGGSKCNTCKAGTFGLTKDNPAGCKQCFCFGRSTQCVDTKYNWDKIRLQKEIESNEPISFDTISLPKQFMGDLTTSYDGYLSVSGSGGKFTVFLTGNGVSIESDLCTNELRLNEINWKIISGHDKLSGCDYGLTRECFLVILQKVTTIVVQSQDMEILEVLLDAAKPYIPYNRTSHSIEHCICPPEYSGLSCQDPNTGYYRDYIATHTAWIDRAIGIAKPCECNRKSNQCNPDSGECENCLDHTAGFHCELCDSGYYQDYSKNCQPCQCPSEFENNAESCVIKKHGFACQCKIGYGGSKCDSCKENYYRDVKTNKCVPCNCNNYGSYYNTCNPDGSCQCKSGFHGEKCNQCRNMREYIKDGVCTPCDQCTQLLFDDIDRLDEALVGLNQTLKEGIGPPWKLLATVRDRLKHLNKKFTYKTGRVSRLQQMDDTRELQDEVYELDEKVKQISMIATKLKNDSQNNYDHLIRYKTDLKELRTELNEIIKNLKHFGEQHVDIDSALAQAVNILKEMKSKVSQKLLELEDEYFAVFNYCDSIAKTVNRIFTNSSSNVLPFNDFKNFNDKIAEIDLLTKDAETQNGIAEYQNDVNKRTFEVLKGKINELEDLEYDTNESLEDIGKKLGLVNEKLKELQMLLENNMDTNDFDMMEEKLADFLDDYDDQSTELHDLVLQATTHMENLKRIVADRIGALNFTKDETEKIKSTEAYNDIIDGVAKAKITAEEARILLKKALDLINSDKSDNLLDQANLSQAKSDRLKHRITNMKDLTNILDDRKREIDNIKASLYDSGKENNRMNPQLQYIDEQIISKEYLVNRLHEAINNSSRIITEMRELENTISGLNISVRYDLFNEKDRYFNARREAEEEIDRAKKAAKEAINTVTRMLTQQIDDTPVKVGQLKLDKVTAQIRQLENKILYAKQAVASINVPLRLYECAMQYTSPLGQTDLFRKLAITFKCTDCQLFNWKQLNIKINSGSAVLNFYDEQPRNDFENPVIELKTKDEVKVEKTLLVERVGSFLQMKFNKDADWKRMYIGNIPLVIEQGDHIEIGSTGSSETKAYISKLFINDNKMGLWNFNSTAGFCTGQMEDNHVETETMSSFYYGQGFKKYVNSTLKPSEFSLEFIFSTFDENNLIYLAQELEHPSATISLTLEDGSLRFRVQHSNGNFVDKKFDDKYNDGRIYSVTIAMKHDGQDQSYSIETVKRNHTMKSVLPRKYSFRIKMANHYVGGIPPTLSLNSVNANTKSFLGFLKLSESFPGVNAMSTGNFLKAGELELYKAWFKGNGSLKLYVPLQHTNSSQTLESIAFTLRPMNAQAPIMEIPHFGSITLSNRTLQINLDNGEHYLATTRTELNINNYNMVNITFRNNAIEIMVNDKSEKITRSKKDNLLKGRKEIDLAIGRIGDSFFYGGISDIFINKQSIPFSANTVTNFYNVEIGREPPMIRQRNNITLKGLSAIPFINMSNSMQGTQGCAPTSTYTTDPTAVNFVDHLESYIKIKTHFLKKDFKLEFEFRTLHSNGLIMIALGTASPPQYNVLEIRDGVLFFRVKGKKKIPKNWPLMFPNKVNDGEWHYVKITRKNGKRLQMWLDGVAKKPVRMPKAALKNEIFLGNVPKDYVSNKELRDLIRPFRGCINNFRINEESKLLGKNTTDIVYNNIRQCFTKIEEGAYFGGDAHAIFKEGFRINKFLELSFEFRTTEQNGIFLSVSNEANYPALSIELQNGAVVMSIDLGNGIQSNVTNNLDSDFALCNNMWHKVSAFYSTSELTINVDGIRKSWVQSDPNSSMDEIDAPLYIGGLPDDGAIGTLKTRENFKGCMKNLRIENHLKDWSLMEELNGVLLNSCPVIAAS